MELSKSQYRLAKEVLRMGILQRHEQWQQKLAELLSRPFDEEIGNAYDRSMLITRSARDWFKESERMENWYHKSSILMAIEWLKDEGFLSDDEAVSIWENGQ